MIPGLLTNARPFRRGLVLLATWCLLTVVLRAAKPPEYSFHNFTYTIVDDEVTVIDYPTKEVGVLKVPPYLGGYPVTAIGDFAFADCSGLTAVTFPATVRSFGKAAFSGCSGLTTFVIHSTIQSIGAYAFANCSGLTSVTIYPGVVSIGSRAFGNCDALTFIWIPATVTSLSREAFAKCRNLTTVQVDMDNPNYSSADGILFDKDQTTLLGYPAGKPREYSVPASVEAIGDGAFSGCSRLRRVTIPSTVTRIGSSAFYECSDLAEIGLPSGISKIGSNTFYSCSSLKEVRIPSGVTQIGDYAFASCEKLTRVAIPDSVSAIGTSAFRRCRALTEINIPPAVDRILEVTFSDCASLREIVIPAGVEYIGRSAFDYCSSLASIKFLGDAPLSPTHGFYEIPEDFKVYYYQGSKGFVGNRWEGYPAVPVGPEIAVQQPAGANLAGGVSKKTFGTTVVGARGRSKTFTIRNTGTGKLGSLTTTLVGGDSSDFTVTAPLKVLLAPGELTTFKVTFSPKKSGSLGSTLRISSNDSIQGSFDVEVTGLGVD